MMSHNSTTPNVANANEFVIGFCVVLLIFGAMVYVGGVAMGGMIRRLGLGESENSAATNSPSVTPLLGDARAQTSGQPTGETSRLP